MQKDFTVKVHAIDSESGLAEMNFNTADWVVNPVDNKFFTVPGKDGVIETLKANVEIVKRNDGATSYLSTSTLADVAELLGIEKTKVEDKEESKKEVKKEKTV